MNEKREENKKMKLEELLKDIDSNVAEFNLEQDFEEDCVMAHWTAAMTR